MSGPGAGSLEVGCVSTGALGTQLLPLHGAPQGQPQTRSLLPVVDFPVISLGLSTNISLQYAYILIKSIYIAKVWKYIQYIKVLKMLSKVVVQELKKIYIYLYFEKFSIKMFNMTKYIFNFY